MPNFEIINEVNTDRKAVAFTFDDGPNPVYTPQVLEIFSEAGAKATFFMIGSQMELHPELVKLAYEQGHEIGNHTFTHPSLPELHKQEIKDELIQTDSLIEKITGTRPQVFRPPYFAYNEQAAGIVGEMGYPAIGAVNGDATDWEMPGVEHIVDKSREQVRPGSILIFHDGYDDRSQTVEAVRILVKELTADGYELLTVSELLRS
ncbi:peptidoglycan/xylan/chitin deacetylase (PgdA/CDA1 family) [Fontibacillus phaseoli]|uniref:Peptidoglycan/xylan/chitin deacetylase (PgdA/CDA1 family) n=1 Tax=Fontibacillus phaseoli TaxID=1416533 RepID=A0A369BDY9_9BACL|nr:polysaccharide deacetylase family protein [Fontibacillus phaseoli]RCX18687.1 peptidoglycan/xylan/chitin deacetylase (PgdA/CDA1 family) [Fontibacillus phaseoli]